MNGDASTDAQRTSASATRSARSHRSASSTAIERNANLTNGVHDEDAESEAETLITSPVKKAEAAKQNAAAGRREKQNMTKDDDPQDGELDAPGSPDSPQARSAPKSSAKLKDSKAATDGSQSDGSSDDLSDADNASDSSATEHSRRLSQSDLQSSNPRKRKHRASSVSLPNKRPTIDTTRRRKRGATEDRDAPESPQSRSHRRAASIQFAQDGTDITSGRKRRSNPPGRENSKSTRKAWDEDSMSSETTSLGQQESKRPQRGIVRATSTPGRPVGREAKRHVNKYGYTRLAEACEAGDLDLVKEWREKDPEQLEIAEFAGNKPLQIAAINGNVEVVNYLIAQGCQIDCENTERDTPLIDAAENGHADVVDILLNAGVDPLRGNRKGQQALDVINDETENVSQIRASLRAAIERWSSDDARQRREEEEEERYRIGPSKELHFMARSYENLLRLVAVNDRNGVREFLDARVPVDNAVIAAAAKTGDLYLVNMLYAEMPEKKRYQKAEKPMLSVLGTNHFDTVKTLTDLDQFNPRWRNRQDKSWSEIAAERAGPQWRAEVELLGRLEKEALEGPKLRLSSSPVVRRSEAASKNRPSTGSKTNDDSEVEVSDPDTPKQRKNGRRLLSRKDMRVASGKKRNNASDDSASADESSDEPPPAPASPKERRGLGRPRTKPTNVKAEEVDDRDKARPASHKLAAQPTLSSVAENAEITAKSPAANDANDSVLADRDGDNVVDLPQTGGVAEEAASKDDMETAASAQQLELDLQHAAEQEQAQQEADQRQQAEDARLRQLEETRLAEQQREAEMAQAKAEARRNIVDGIPRHIAMLLDSESDFSYEELGAADTILRSVEPVQIVYASDLSTKRYSDFANAEPFVLNIAVAPLLGKDRGLDALLGDEHYPAEIWDTALSVLDDEKHFLLPLLRKSAFAHHDRYDDEMMIDDNQDDFVTDLQTAANMQQSASEAYHKLLSAPLTMRWLSLQRVLEHLHPSLRYTDIVLGEDWRSVLRKGLRVAAEKVDKETDFFDDISRRWQQSSAPRSCRSGQPLLPSQPLTSAGWTDIKVTGER